jgi:hypothetical protein
MVEEFASAGIEGPSQSTFPEARSRPSAAELEQLGDEIAVYTAYETAVVYQQLVRLREFDRWEGWSGGFATCGHWLSWRTGLDRGAARERVRVARALEQLPRLGESLRTGALSYSKVRALTRIATPANEQSLHEFALQSTAAQLERLVRAWRTVDRQEEAQQERVRHAARSLTLCPLDDGSYELRGRLEPEAALVLQRALEAAAWELYRDGQPNRESPVTARRADALALVAECALQSGRLSGRPTLPSQPSTPDPAEVAVNHPDHRMVVLHVDGDVLEAEAGTGDAVLDDGTRVSAETARRFSCDASRVGMTHAPDGSIIAVGRRTRTVGSALRRKLDHRDGGCRFPGCRSRFCDAHHIEHWADGGETSLDNLVLLCRMHHRAVHEDGFTVEMAPEGPRFETPDGRPLPEAPASPRLPPDPIGVLRASWDADGVRFSPESGRSGWTGERFDVDYAIAVLWQRADPMEAAS